MELSFEATDSFTNPAQSDVENPKPVDLRRADPELGKVRVRHKPVQILRRTPRWSIFGERQHPDGLDRSEVTANEDVEINVLPNSSLTIQYYLRPEFFVRKTFGYFPHLSKH
jgi:hypothetical protein